MALRANKDNYFYLWKTRMVLFLVGSNLEIPYFLENGPYVPSTPVHGAPTTATTAAVAERTIIKEVDQWTDEHKRLVNIDTKARSLISMSLPDDVFHFVCHLRTAKDIWNTLCIQYEGIAALLESRKINPIRQYEKLISMKGETPSHVHQRFHCLLIDLKIIGTIYPNSTIVTKFVEALPESWQTYTIRQ